MPLLDISDLNVGYGETQVLIDVALDVAHGESVSVLGPNGAGKTTLIRTIAGLLTPESGSIAYEGPDGMIELTERPAHERVSQGIALTPEGRQLFDQMTVEENLRMGGVTQTRTDLERGLEEMYDLFPILDDRRNQKAGSLSGGQQQMVAIARSLLSDPSLLLMDEPSMGLAPKIIGNVRDRLKSIKAERDINLLLVEQNIDFAFELTDTVYVLEHGEIGASGTTEKMRGSEEIQKSYLGATK